VPNDPLRLSRRTALLTAALSVGAAVLVAGCDDEPDRSGTPGATAGPGGSTRPPPSTDPTVVTALMAAATQIEQLALRYSSVSQTYPALRTQLAAGVQHHASQVARLKEVAGSEPAQPGKLPALPKTAAAALADLATREQKLSVAHATAAGRLTGQAARLLAMIAAGESQLAATLTKKKAAR
jgi:hypothetical protein